MPEKMKKQKMPTTIFALCGKGGVGKTAMSAMLVNLLSADPRKRVLAIDADPAVGLATALGIDVVKTVDDIRNDLIRSVESGSGEEKADVMERLDYEMFSALVEVDNFAFLAIGRPEKEGCYCQVNSILKDIIASFVGHFDYVVIDGEAGVEQVNRRVMERVTHLLLVSDGSMKGLNVVKTIQEVSQSAIAYEASGLILNRVREGDADKVAIPSGLRLLGTIPEDDTIRQFDMEGRSMLGMPDGETARSLRHCIAAMGVSVQAPAFA